MGKLEDLRDSTTEEGGRSMFTRENIVIVILSILLAACVIAAFSFYTSNRDMKQTLQACEKRLSEQDKKVAELTEVQMKQMKSTYDTLVSDLKDQIQKQEVTIKEFHEALSLNFIDRILFEFGKADLTPEGEKILKKVGEALKNIKGKKIRVTGHTDPVPIHPDYQSINSLPIGNSLLHGLHPWSGIFKKKLVWIPRIWKRSVVPSINLKPVMTPKKGVPGTEGLRF